MHIHKLNHAVNVINMICSLAEEGWSVKVHDEVIATSHGNKKIAKIMAAKQAICIIQSNPSLFHHLCNCNQDMPPTSNNTPTIDNTNNMNNTNNNMHNTNNINNTNSKANNVYNTVTGTAPINMAFKLPQK